MNASHHLSNSRCFLAHSEISQFHFDIIWRDFDEWKAVVHYATTWTGHTQWFFIMKNWICKIAHAEKVRTSRSICDETKKIFTFKVLIWLMICSLIRLPRQYGWSRPPLTQNVMSPDEVDSPRKPAFVRIFCTWYASSLVNLNDFDPCFWTIGWIRGKRLIEISKRFINFVLSFLPWLDQDLKGIYWRD